MSVTDIDLLRHDEGDHRLEFIVEDKLRNFGRWHPAIIRGEHAADFSDAYFHPPAPVPWAGVSIIHDAEVVTDGLTIQDDKMFVGNSLMYPLSVFPYSHSTLQFRRSTDGRYDVELPDNVITLAGTTANIVCDGWPIYGHWIVDVLPRLYRAMRSGFVIDTFLFPGPPRDWQIQMLEAVGVDVDRCRFVDFASATVRCERLIVPTYDRFNSEIRPALLRVHKFLRDECGVKSVPAPNRDLFVSRRDWGGSRTLINRTEVEELCSDLGFEIVRPETLPFVEQVKLFASARSVMGDCGSGMHNAVFSGHDVKVGILQNQANHNFLQSQIGMILNHQLHYIVGVSDNDDTDSYAVDLQDVRYVASLVKA